MVLTVGGRMARRMIFSRASARQLCLARRRRVLGWARAARRCPRLWWRTCLRRHRHRRAVRSSQHQYRRTRLLLLRLRLRIRHPARLLH